MTSKSQLLDQGIIRTLKAYTRCHFVHWYIEQLEKCGFNKVAKLQKFDVYQAIVWIVSAWNQVKPNSIRCCFQRSTVKVYCLVVGPGQLSSVTLVPLFTGDEPLQIEEQDAAEISVILAELESSVAALQQHGIYDSVNINEFLELAVEMVEDCAANQEQYILDSFKPSMTEEEELGYDGSVERPAIKLTQDLDAFRTLQEYERQRDDFSKMRVQQLEKMLEELEIKQRAGKIQKSIASFFSSLS